MWMQNLLVVLIVVCGSYGKHFHGGSMSWKPINNGEQIEVMYNVGFKLEHNEQGFDACTPDAQQSRTELKGSGYLTCDSCSGEDRSRRLLWICDAYNTELDSSVGGNVAVYNVPSLSAGTKFTISYESCCWIKLKSPDRGSGAKWWKMMTEINVQHRTDINRINSSPVTAPIPVEKFRGGCVYKLRIAVSDPDNDVVLCRNMKKEECPQESGRDRACGIPTSGLTVNSDCTLVFDTRVAGEGYHAANVMIRDCPSKKNCKKPYSKVPLLFILNVADSSETCMSKPTIIIPPACHTVSPGDTFEIDIKAEAGDPSLPIHKIFSYKPTGMTESNMQSVPGSVNQKFVKYTWTPRPSLEDIGVHNLCFSAHDSEGYTSGYSCTFLRVTPDPPVTVNKYASSPAEGAEHVVDIKQPLVIRFSGDIDRPTSKAFIRIVNRQSNTVVYEFNAKKSNELTYINNTIEIAPLEDRWPLVLGDGAIPFGIELDDGVAIPRNGGCPTAAAEWDFLLKGDGDEAILPHATCPEDSPQKDPAECESIYKETIIKPNGDPEFTGHYLCCSCIEPVKNARPPEPRGGPPGGPSGGPPGTR